MQDTLGDHFRALTMRMLFQNVRDREGGRERRRGKREESEGEKRERERGTKREEARERGKEGEREGERKRGGGGDAPPSLTRRALKGF